MLEPCPDLFWTEQQQCSLYNNNNNILTKDIFQPRKQSLNKSTHKQTPTARPSHGVTNTRKHRSSNPRHSPRSVLKKVPGHVLREEPAALLSHRCVLGKSQSGGCSDVSQPGPTHDQQFHELTHHFLSSRYCDFKTSTGRAGPYGKYDFLK